MTFIIITRNTKNEIFFVHFADLEASWRGCSEFDEGTSRTHYFSIATPPAPSLPKLATGARSRPEQAAVKWGPVWELLAGLLENSKSVILINYNDAGYLAASPLPPLSLSLCSQKSSQWIKSSRPPSGTNALLQYQRLWRHGLNSKVARPTDPFRPVSRPAYFFWPASTSPVPPPFSIRCFGTTGRSMSGWADGWDSDRGEEGEGKIPEYLNPPHIHPGIRESSSQSAHTNPAYVTLPECWSLFPPLPPSASSLHQLR